MRPAPLGVWHVGDDLAGLAKGSGPRETRGVSTRISAVLDPMVNCLAVELNQDNKTQRVLIHLVASTARTGRTRRVTVARTAGLRAQDWNSRRDVTLKASTYEYCAEEPISCRGRGYVETTASGVA